MQLSVKMTKSTIYQLVDAINEILSLETKILDYQLRTS
jgi:hypothetical protein